MKAQFVTIVRVMLRVVFSVWSQILIPAKEGVSQEEKELLSQYLRSQIFRKAKKVAAYIQKKFDVNYSVSGVSALFHSIGFTYKKAKAVSGKADAEKKELFILEYMRIRSELDRKIYFADSNHPQHNPIIIFTVGLRDVKSLRSPATPADTTRTCDWVNADSIGDLLRALRSKNPIGEVIHLIMDNARNNRSAKSERKSKALEIVQEKSSL